MKLTKLKKFTPALRGVAATTAALLTLTTVGYSVAKSELAIGWVDGYFGVDRTIYKEWDEKIPSYTIPGAVEGYSYLKGKSYETKHDTIESFFDDFVANAVKQGEEGFALLKNDNSALPLDKSKEVVLFGWSAYHVPGGHTGVVAENKVGSVTNPWTGETTNYDAYTLQKTLYTSFSEMSDVKLNTTVTADDFTGAMKSAGNYVDNYELPEVFNVNNSWNIKADSTAIVVVGRGGGEGSNYKEDSIGEDRKDPLALSDEELEMIKYAKDNCGKVVLLIVSANAMELGPVVEHGGVYEVDSIGFCGIPNDYQYGGIANVLAGKVNATGGLTATYVYDNSYNPAVINMGQQQYADLDTITSTPDYLGRTGNINYSANNYIVEAEGVYVGYKYYETRYFDSMANPTYNANSAVGNMAEWSYDKEVIFPFGQSLSYQQYEQRLVNVVVDNVETGKITATVEVTNKSDKEGYFLTQLYVNRPYTQYDIKNNVEKSAVDFINSAKVKVAAGASKKVDITLPTRYLASWDSSALNGAGTYVLDEGTYYFTAAENAHAAANNFLDVQGHETDGTTAIGECKTWQLDKFDDKTFSESNGVEVRNQMENADVNYFTGEDTVTYLSRSNWKDTFPKNYTNYVNGSGIASEEKLTIKGSAKADEWVRELQNAQYKVTPDADSSKWASFEGVKPEGLGDNQTVWQWIMSFATSDPEAFSDIHSDEWKAVAAAINLGSALNSVGESGGTSKTFAEIGNPISVQSESVAGYQQTITMENGKTFTLNIASNTLLGSSFNPDLAYEWGLLEGESGLWLQKTGAGSGNAITVWGAGLNQQRHPYNGRNSEYMSEDPMLTNRIGEAQMRGAVEMGAICGPKHMGFNDQELNRQGNACYMTEQKVRETDTRCYEGALRIDEGKGTGVMMSFARIGATNTTNSVGYINNIMRGEWGFTGIISTDMGRSNYHEVGSMIMASVNEYAGFGSGTIYTDSTDESATVNKAAYITLGDARKDSKFAAQARQTALYMIYTLAHSGSGLYVERIENNGEDIVVDGYTIKHRDPAGTLDKAGWEYIFISLSAVFGVIMGLAGIAWIASAVVPNKEEE